MRLEEIQVLLGPSSSNGGLEVKKFIRQFCGALVLVVLAPLLSMIAIFYSFSAAVETVIVSMSSPSGGSVASIERYNQFVIKLVDCLMGE